MGCLLLTGGTGLLGAYLVRDLLRAGKSLALIVRPTRKTSAESRIEDLMAHWEAEGRSALPRPMVFEGDLRAEQLGLDARALDWIASNCDAVLHNAASLTFTAGGPEDEPWQTNLHGTRRVLDVCRCTGIRKFHHVSTAYVCGLRTGRILESELDVGQTHGNDYEISKFRAETMVLDSDCLDRPTIYRPGIILGDSRTGYTSTFYGFYAPLKLLSTLLSRAAGVASTREELIAGIRFAGQRLTEVLRLSDQERKNYVPVDWVSAVMTHVFCHPEHHGKTYHLTPNEPVSVRLTREVMESVFEKYTELAERKTHHEAEWSHFESYFIDGMKVYESYWRDDPVFDTTNTLSAAPEIPCPVMDAAFFTRICEFAIESNFGRRSRPAAALPPCNVHQRLERWMISSNGAGNPRNTRYVGLRIDGAGGGQWELALVNDRLASVRPGITVRCTATFQLDSRTFASLASEKTTAMEAIQSGRVRVEGNGLSLGAFARVLEDAATGAP